MWFRWEHSAIGWSPVVFHMEQPSQTNAVRATAHWPVPADCIGEDGAPMFGRLVQRFPKPVEVDG